MRLKKIITMVCAAIMSVTAMSMSAFAMETIEGEDGVVLIMYNSETDEIPSVPVATDIDNFSFNMTIPAYPSSAFLTSTSGVKNLELDEEQTVIQMNFDSTGSFNYINLYDVTTRKYVLGSSTELVGLGMTNDVFCLTNLTGNHTYRIRLSAITKKSNVTGTVISY